MNLEDGVNIIQSIEEQLLDYFEMTQALDISSASHMPSKRGNYQSIYLSISQSNRSYHVIVTIRIILFSGNIHLESISNNWRTYTRIYSSFPTRYPKHRQEIDLQTTGMYIQSSILSA